jgi:hypothetical protein
MLWRACFRDSSSSPLIVALLLMRTAGQLALPDPTDTSCGAAFWTICLGWCVASPAALARCVTA